MKKKSIYLFLMIASIILLGATKVMAGDYTYTKITSADGKWVLGYVCDDRVYYYVEEFEEDGNPEIDYAFICNYKGNDIEVKVPANDRSIPIKEIEISAFADNKTMKTVTIPEGITLLEAGAFANCRNLESVKLPSTLKEIQYGAFQNCVSLKEIRIPKTVTIMTGEYYDYDKRVDADIFKGCKNLTIICDPGSRALQYAFDYNIRYSLTSKINIKSDKDMWDYIDTQNKNYSGKAKKTEIYLTYSYTLKDAWGDYNYSYYDLKEGTDYTVSYQNNTNIGTATVTITGKGNYTGTITKTFKIVPKKVTIKSVKNSKKKSAKITWTKDSSVTGYEVYVSERVVDKNYMTVNAKKLSLREKPTTKSEEYCVLWKGCKVRILKKNVKKANGYTWYKVRLEGEGDSVEGYVASKYLSTAYKAKSYKKVTTIKKNKTTSYTAKKLKKGKKYYVRVRSYKTVNGKKICGDYSKVKSVKIKK